MAKPGRIGVWALRRGNHLGQRSCADAQKGRTYERKQSDRGSLTFSSCKQGVVHIWHLLENVSRTFAEAVRQSMRAIRNALCAVAIDPALLTAAERLQYEGFLRREETTRHILALREAGHSIKEIVRRTRHSRKLVRQAVRGERGDVFRVRQSSLDAWMPGCRCWMPCGMRAAATAPTSGGGYASRASAAPCALWSRGRPGTGGWSRCGCRECRSRHRPARWRGL